MSALVGNQWGIETIYSGLAQGLGAELVFAAFRYSAGVLLAACSRVPAPAPRRGRSTTSVLWYACDDAAFTGVYFVTVVLSGAILAGLLAGSSCGRSRRPGALDRFAAGRDVTERV